MLKPASLRAALEAALPELKANPDRLIVFIENGSISSTYSGNLSFQYAYTLRVIVTDYARHADTLMLPLLDWLYRNQPDILANYDQHAAGITFEAELLNHDTMDLDIRVKLTERVTTAPNPDGGTILTHHPEPPLDPYDYIESWRLFIRHPDGSQEEILPDNEGKTPP